MQITATRWSATRAADRARQVPRERTRDLPAPADSGESVALVEREFLGTAASFGRLLRALREG